MKRFKYIVFITLTLCLFFIVLSYVFSKHYNNYSVSKKNCTIKSMPTKTYKSFNPNYDKFSNTKSNINKRYNTFEIDLSKLHCLNKCNQVILVTTKDFKTCHAKISTYEKRKRDWIRIYGPFDGVIGMNGFSTNKHEGDKCSPIGVFSIISLFGWSNNHPFKMNYRKTTINDYWVSNRNLKEYNVWINYKGNPKKRFYDYENLAKQPLYKYAAILNYNYDKNKVMDKGSGIFLHLRPPAGGGTLGCTAISEDHIFDIFKWLDPKKNPLILQGPIDVIKKMY